MIVLSCRAVVSVRPVFLPIIRQEPQKNNPGLCEQKDFLCALHPAAGICPLAPWNLYRRREVTPPYGKSASFILHALFRSYGILPQPASPAAPSPREPMACICFGIRSRIENRMCFSIQRIEKLLNYSLFILQSSVFMKPPASWEAGGSFYFAYSMALVSRMTLTLIWPGYSSSDSIFLAMSRARRIMASSPTSSGLTMMRTSRPAWMA